MGMTTCRLLGVVECERGRARVPSVGGFFDDLHFSLAFWAGQRVDLVDLLDQPSPVFINTIFTTCPTPRYRGPGNPRLPSLRLFHAALFEEGGTLTSHFMGRYDCADYTAGVMNSGKYQVILPYNGDQVFGFVQDFEMDFAIPYLQIHKIILGLQGTHKGGVRYPIPFFMNWEATFPAKYVELEKMWREGKE